MSSGDSPRSMKSTGHFATASHGGNISHRTLRRKRTQSESQSFQRPKSLAFDSISRKLVERQPKEPQVGGQSNDCCVKNLSKLRISQVPENVANRHGFSVFIFHSSPPFPQKTTHFLTVSAQPMTAEQNRESYGKGEKPL